jgi:hypothetical protein
MSTPLNDWIRNHDERWSFILVYVGGAILLSVYADLFWVIMLMLVHFGLELWRHIIMKVDKTLLQALWHVKLDFALVLFALVIALYADFVLAALGIGQAARAGQAVRGAQMLTRFAIIERGLRIFFLTVDDIARVATIVWRSFKKNGASKKQTEVAMEHARELLEEEDPYDHTRGPWQKLSNGDKFSLGFGAVCLLLILFAPVIMGTSAEHTWSTLASELRPF